MGNKHSKDLLDEETGASTDYQPNTKYGSQRSSFSDQYGSYRTRESSFGTSESSDVQSTSSAEQTSISEKGEEERRSREFAVIKSQFLRKSIEDKLPEDASAGNAEFDGFVYHEPVLIKHIHTTTEELRDIASRIEAAKRNIHTSSGDLLQIYSNTLIAFREYGFVDDSIVKVTKKLDENAKIQDSVTIGFMTAGESLCKRMQRLSVQMEKVTVPVLERVNKNPRN